MTGLSPAPITADDVLGFVSASPATVLDLVTASPQTVLDINAGAAAGAVGSYGFFTKTDSPAYGFGATISASVLRASNAGAYSDGATISGSWRCMGYARGNTTANDHETTVFLRIA